MDDDPATSGGRVRAHGRWTRRLRIALPSHPGGANAAYAQAGDGIGWLESRCSSTLGRRALS